MTGVNALEVERVTYTDEEALYVEGLYESGDFDLFKETLDNNPEVTLIVFGPSTGGLTSESYPISRLIRSNKLNTIVATGAVCVSSCTIAWMGGVDRFMEDGSELWIHRPYLPAEEFSKILDEGNCSDMMDTEIEIDTCSNWTDAERLEIQDLQTGRIVYEFALFMHELEFPIEFILKALDTNPWEFYKIIK